MIKNIAIFDLGSNSTRMAIYQVDSDGSFREIKRFKKMTRLAEGMGQNSRQSNLSKAAMRRTISALKGFKHECGQVPGVVIRGVATGAVRNAANNGEFLELVKKEVGVDIEILSGNSEAYYDYAGVMHAFDLKNCLICDMGGASFELVLVKDRKASNFISIPYGAVTLSEKYHAHDKIGAADFFALQRFILYKFHQLPWLTEGRGFPLVLLGGANRTVARQGKQPGGQTDPQNLHGRKMSTFSFLEIFQRWLGLDKKEREAQLGVEKERADIIIAGLTPIVLMIQKYAVTNIIFSESGVREGIIAESLKK